MKYNPKAPDIRYQILLLASALVAAPAFAHHPTAGAVGAGSGINVLSPDTMRDGDWFVGSRLTYARPDQRSDEELATLAGHHIHAHNTDFNINAASGFSYGFTDQLTLSAELPYVHRDDMQEGHHAHHGGHAMNDVVERGDAAGIGDLSVLATYNVARSEHAGFALMAGIKVPTGSTHKVDGHGQRFETEHQPGSGSWDPMIGAAGRIKLGAFNFNASVLYQFSTRGAQDTELGDRAIAGVSLSHRFSPAPNHHEQAADSHDHENGGHEHAARHGHSSWDAFVELTGEWEGRQKIAGKIEETSGGKSVWMTPGARFNSASGWSIGGGVGLPLWQDIRESHPENEYRVTLSIGRSF